MNIGQLDKESGGSVYDGEWKAASNLLAGDVLQKMDGSTVYVTEVTVEKLPEIINVYNLEIEDLHTYYVADGMLVHNEYSQNDKSPNVDEGGSESVLPPNTKPDFIVTPEGTVMDTSKNYNLVGSGEQGDWFQIHNYGKPEDGFGFPHTHKPQLNTNGTNTSYKRVVSNTTAADIDYADELLRTGKMTFRKKGRR